MLFFLIVIGVVVWFFFFRRPIQRTKKKQTEELMIECCECGTYISSEEAIVKRGEYFCSKTCLNKRGQR
ncbi:hypothetical protein BKH44_06690 [Helicobacter sp. 13S00477-4]|nr:hypothetical protein BKH44_06690 [Helicobacter sp. 13S00477-4]